jgi:5-formyltetrahydrofolate cyclo-ligase
MGFPSFMIIPSMTGSAKDILRHEAKQRRDRIVPGDAAGVIPRFIDALKPQAGQAVGLYRAKGTEFNPALLYTALQTMGCLCALPVMAPQSRILRFALWRDGEPLEQGPFGIDQPPDTPRTVWINPSLLVLPLLAYDRQGNRLGYGGGYYDATLHALRLPGPVTAAGLAHDGQEAPEALPAEPHDIPLDWLFTPLQTLHFVQ